MPIINSENIVCDVCGCKITRGEERMVISREAYWTDAGIFTLAHTRKFSHLSCIEDAIQNYTEKHWDI